MIRALITVFKHAYWNFSISQNSLHKSQQQCVLNVSLSDINVSQLVRWLSKDNPENTEYREVMRSCYIFKWTEFNILTNKVRAGVACEIICNMIGIWWPALDYENFAKLWDCL